MKNLVIRSALIGAASGFVAIAVATLGAFLLPIPANGEHIEFLFYVLLLIGMPVGTVLTLLLQEALGTGGLWNAVAIAGFFAVLNWTVVGFLYGVLRRWHTQRKQAIGTGRIEG